MIGKLKHRSTVMAQCCLSVGLVLAAVGCPELPEPQCLDGSLQYLRETMDRYHGKRFWVYEDADSAGNHFFVWPSFSKAGNETNCLIVIHGDTRDAIPGGASSCPDNENDAAHVEWRRYDAPADGTATFSLCGSSFATVLSIHTGCPGTEGNEVTYECDGDPGNELCRACSDDACDQQSELTIPVEAGHSYLIRIAGKDEAAGSYTLTIDGPAAPDAEPNQNCGVSVEFDAFAPGAYQGATAIEFRLNYTEVDDWGGLVMNNGVFDPIEEGGVLRPNYGWDCGAGVDLTGAQALKFHARGEKGGELVKFFVGGVGWDGSNPVTDCHGSTMAIGGEISLGTDWQEYTIPLGSANLSYVIGGFGWAANAEGDPDLHSAGSDNALVFYVDQIYFELSDDAAEERLWESPRFLQSFTTRPVQWDPIAGDFDHRFRKVAFVYDNALALLAFLAEGTEDGLARARLIGEAFVYAANHDRTLTDGQLRSDYAAGDLALPPGWIPNGFEGEVQLSGFFNLQCQEYQQLFTDNISTGNTAWAAVALLALYEHTAGDSYLEAARRLGAFIEQFRNDTCEDASGRLVGGYMGGLKDIEQDEPTPEPFSSAEHNIDVYAAFRVLAENEDDQEDKQVWVSGADHAKRHVWSLWDKRRKCFYAGKDLDCQINKEPGQLPLDVQAWAVLGIPGTLKECHGVLNGAALRHYFTRSDGFTGFDFNDDKDGVWFEGTAHMATALAFANRLQWAAALCNELCRAQAELPEPPLRGELPSPFDQPIGLVAGSHDGISTGFGFEVYKRLHVGATAWNVFAQLGVNPYYLTPAPRPR